MGNLLPFEEEWKKKGFCKAHFFNLIEKICKTRTQLLFPSRAYKLREERK